eukprot:3168762-Rhodomonas_salina.1
MLAAQTGCGGGNGGCAGGDGKKRPRRDRNGKQPFSFPSTPHPCCPSPSTRHCTLAVLLLPPDTAPCIHTLAVLLLLSDAAPSPSFSSSLTQHPS